MLPSTALLGIRPWLGMAMVASCLAMPLAASSHREAPAITRSPQVDGTDFYMFRSYEAGRSDFVTLIANYNPLQDPFGGPNYYPLSRDAHYDIHIDNDGDAVEDITFRFPFSNNVGPLGFRLGPDDTPVFAPLTLLAPVEAGADLTLALNVERPYYVRVVRGALGSENREERFVTESNGGSAQFEMPFDYAGEKSFPDYEAYAAQYVYNVSIPGCPRDGRMFVGARKESFAVNLGEIFDLINLDPLGAPDEKASAIENKNITGIALEIPVNCLVGDSGPVIAGWTTASLPRNRTSRDIEPTNALAERRVASSGFEVHSGDFVQVSRLGNPLVNEVVIGLPDKNLFNASHPSGDGQFALYVTNPTLPALIEMLFPSARAPTRFPRGDLVAAFLSGLDGVNANGSTAEMLRLNTSIPPVDSARQNNLGVIAGDNAGFPNGRRPGDDVVDIALRVLMGRLCHLGLGLCDPADAPAGMLDFTDQTIQNAAQFDDVFPYLKTPLPGSVQ